MATPGEGQCASTNPERPSCTWRNSSQPGSLGGQGQAASDPSPPELCSKHSTRPDRKPALRAPRPGAAGQRTTVEQTCTKPHKKSSLKGSRRVSTERRHPAARGPTGARQPSKAKVGEVCKANRVWTRAGEYHTCIPRHSTSTREKETRKGTEPRRYTPENSPTGHVQRSTERQGKKGSEKRINQ